MKWLEVRIHTTAEATDAVSVLCTELGAAGVAIEDSETLMNEVDGDRVTVKAYYPENYGSDIIALLNQKLSEAAEYVNIGEIRIDTNELDEQDWANNWKKYYKPFNITPNIVIRPTWEEYTPGKTEKVIELDPGMAFGTGTHESTKLCAELISEYTQKGWRCADIGTGTGILAMLMVLHGAAGVEAVDTDPTAVKAARENIELNGMEAAVSVSKGSVDTLPKGKYKLVAANIIADVIISMSDDIHKIMAKGGFFITSGIIRERAEEVKRKYTGLGFIVQKFLEMGEWVGICFKWPGSL